MNHFRRTAAALALATGLLAATATAPAGAVPIAPDIKGLQGFDTAGPTGYHRVIWGQPAGSAGGAIDAWQVQRWNGDENALLQTYDVTFGQGPDLTVSGMTDDTLFKYRVRSHNGSGWSGWSGFEPVRVHPNLNHWFPFANESDLVKGHYKDFLGRSPSIGELSTATAQITNAAGVVSFIDGLATRAARIENRHPVIRLYLAYFDRAPDHGGLDYWVDRVDAGTATLNSVSAFFAKSSEFKETYDDLSNSAFVTLVYQNVLDRNPDAGGLAYWKGRLDQKTISRGKLMLGFSESDEGRTLFTGAVTVADVYDAMLPNDPPSDAVLLTYGDLIRAKGTAGDLALFVQYLNDYQPN